MLQLTPTFLTSMLSFQITLKRISIIFSIKTWHNPGTNEKTTYKINCKWLIIKWAQLGSNQRPPDYESDALTN